MFIYPSNFKRNNHLMLITCQKLKSISEYIKCHDLFKQGTLELNENHIFHLNATKHIRRFLNFLSKQNEKIKTKPKINNFRFVF